MKAILLFLTFTVSFSFAQTGINYQGAATDSDGAKLVDQNISLRISVLQGGVDGTTSYSETHNTTTDQFGLFNVVIGQGEVVSGTFDSISWGADAHFLKVELDASGGSDYSLVSTTQMMSVPYALYAENVSLSVDLDSLINSVEELKSDMNIITQFFGCTEPTACNFDENAVIDDGTCEGLIGCTDSNSSNYNPNATCDDQSCNPYVGQFIEGGMVIFVDVSGPKTGLVCSYNNYFGNWTSCYDYAESLTENGYDDWRLPTKEELANFVGDLNTINTFLSTAGIETFNLNDCQTYTEYGCLNHYWSSTQCNSTTKWFLSIATNSTNCRSNEYQMNSRPIRYFDLNEDH